jgi:general L-amino acid transport system permease protein
VIALARRSFATPLNAIVTLAVTITIALVLVPLGRWALIDAVWSGTPAGCRAGGAGACWTFVAHKLRFIVLGLYPPAEQWRPIASIALILGILVYSARPTSWRRWLIGVWIVGVAIFVWLMGGGAGLAPVPPRLWGGLPITLMLTTFGLALGMPIAVLLALGRRSPLVIVRTTSTAIVEIVRGVPLIAVLYVAALVVPLAMPRGLTVDKLLLAQGAVAVFAAAYLAEAVRAGLQVIPRGQADAALALGMRRWQAMRLIVLPQAMKVVIPSFISIAVGFFQDTSLVVIIGLFDLLNTARVAAQDPEWLGFHAEAYTFVAVIYFAGSAGMSRYGLWLERKTARHARLYTPV